MWLSLRGSVADGNDADYLIARCLLCHPGMAIRTTYPPGIQSERLTEQHEIGSCHSKPLTQVGSGFSGEDEVVSHAFGQNELDRRIEGGAVTSYQLDISVVLYVNIVEALIDLLSDLDRNW